MTISLVLLYKGRRADLADALKSLSCQTRLCDQVLAVDASVEQDLQELLDVFKDACPPGLTTCNLGDERDSSLGELFNLAAKSCSGDYLLFLPAHQLLAPKYIELCVQSLEMDETLGAVCTGIRLTGKEDAVFELSIPELLAFPQRDCYPLFRAESFNKIGGFSKVNNHIVFADAVLRIVAAEMRVKFLQECLVLARCDENLDKPSLHKLDNSFARADFLKAHSAVVSQFAEEMVLCLEKEHMRQQQRFDRLIDHAHQNLLFVSNKQKAQEKFHKEQLSSISVTGRHLLCAVKRRLLAK